MTNAAIRTSLRSVPRLPTQPAELEAMRARAWLDQGIVVLRPEDLIDDWLRQAIKTFAAKRWGKRFRR